jgi:hypothetical protein
VLVDERGDRIMQPGEAAMDAATELALGQHGEEALDLVEPGRAGRGVMDVPVRPLARAGSLGKDADSDSAGASEARAVGLQSGFINSLVRTLAIGLTAYNRIAETVTPSAAPLRPG